MKRTLIKEINPKLHDKEVMVQGWVQDLRDLAKIKFIVLRDRTGTIQLVAPKSDVSEEIFEKIPKISTESVISVKGKVNCKAEAKAGKEILISDIEVLSQADTLPIQVLEKDKTIATDLSKRLDHRFLDTRKEKINAIFRVRSKIFKFATEYLDSIGFTNINTPKITAIGVESGAELLAVEYFGKKVYLAQSPQVYKQMFVIGGFERVYEVGPVFRAEKSNTTRHLTEFTGVDFEMGFIKDHNDVMDVIEGMVKHILTNVKTCCKEELELLDVKLEVPKEIPRISMKDAKAMLKEKGKELDADEDLDAEGEKMLGELIKKKYGENFVFVTMYPYAKRPFYHMKPENGEDLTLSFDLLWNGVEVATGAQREHRLDVLKKQAKEKGVELDPIYEEIFKFGAPPHGGVGFGLDRMTQRLLNLDNIREALLLTRDPERVRP